jgi:hypothetical protein
MLSGEEGLNAQPEESTDILKNRELVLVKMDEVNCQP